MAIVVHDGAVDFDSFFQASLAALQDASDAFGGINSSIQVAPAGASNRFIIVFENASVLRFFWNAGHRMPPTIMWTFEHDSAPDDETIDRFFSRVSDAVQSQVPGLRFSRQRSLDDGNLTKGN